MPQCRDGRAATGRARGPPLRKPSCTGGPRARLDENRRVRVGLVPALRLRLTSDAFATRIFYSHGARSLLAVAQGGGSTTATAVDYFRAAVPRG